MERLTVDYGKKFSPFRYAMKDGSDAEIGYFKNYDAFYSHMLMVQKLGEYEDLEEQGLLLRLPCKVGDTIYEVSYENREFVIKEHIVKEFIYRTYRFPRIEIYCENENGFLVCNNIGKLDECLFLTQAEAEQKLKEMENR